jgi:iron-sulfur cluster assembly accessory protein
MKGGCSGYSYVLDFEKTKLADDVEFDEEGIKVIMRPEAKESLSGLKIDYRDGLKGAGFKIVNPNAKRHCGCGSSFA